MQKTIVGGPPELDVAVVPTLVDAPGPTLVDWLGPPVLEVAPFDAVPPVVALGVPDVAPLTDVAPCAPPEPNRSSVLGPLQASRTIAKRPQERTKNRYFKGCLVFQD